MGKLTPCRCCGVVPEVEIRRPTAATEYHYARHDCMGVWSKSAEAAAAEWNADNAAIDPALLASVAEWRQLAETQDAIIQRGAALPAPALLATLEEWLYCYQSEEVNTDRSVTSRLALRDAIAALLASDGAGEATDA